MTDYYTFCENAVIALLQDRLPASIISNKAKQVTASDATLLGHGFDYFAILYPGAFPSTDFAGKIVTVEWEIYVDIFARYKANEKASWEAFKTFRAEVFQLFVSYRTLQRTDTIRNASLRASGEPAYVASKGVPDATPVFITQRLTAVVSQMVNRTGGEYGN